MKRRTLSLLVIVLFSAFVCLLSAVQPWTGDDAEYMFMASGEGFDMTDTPVRTLGDVLSSQWLHYFSVNGRTPAHLLVQAFCGVWGAQAFAVCNGVVYTLFLLLLLRLLRISLDRVGLVVGVVSAVAVTFGTRYGPACQVNYVWMFTLVLPFMLLLRRWLSGRKAVSWWAWPLFALAGIAGGWTQEGLSLGLLFAFFCFFVVGRFHLKADGFDDVGLPATASWRGAAFWLMLMGFAIGTLLIVASPAAWTRLAGLGDAPQLIPVWRGWLMGLRMFWVLTAYIVYCVAWRKMSWRQVLHPIRFSLAAMAALLLMNAALGVMSYRQFFGVELLSIVALFTLLRRETAQTSVAARALCGLLVVGAIGVSYGRWQAVMRERERYDELAAKVQLRTLPDGTSTLYLSETELQDAAADRAAIVAIARQKTRALGRSVRVE